MIYYFFAFVICLIGALINLPGVMNGSLISIAAMAFCSAMALWNLVMGAALLRR
jgi:preprotein translocase subunit SecY